MPLLLIDRSTSTPSRRSSSVPPPDPAHVVPRRCCPSGSADRPRTVSVLPNALADFPEPFGKELQDPLWPVPFPSASSSRPQPAADIHRLPGTLLSLSPPPTGGRSTGKAHEFAAAIPRPTSSIAATLCPPG